MKGDSHITAERAALLPIAVIATGEFLRWEYSTMGIMWAIAFTVISFQFFYWRLWIPIDRPHKISLYVLTAMASSLELDLYVNRELPYMDSARLLLWVPVLAIELALLYAAFKLDRLEY